VCGMEVVYVYRYIYRKREIMKETQESSSRVSGASRNTKKKEKKKSKQYSKTDAVGLCRRAQLVGQRERGGCQQDTKESE
jgi:hypothetical protein